MITIRRSRERGHTDLGWLDSHHTFSFGDYHDRDFVNCGTLHVLNQDLVQPGKGFGTHHHKDMEIISLVLEGVMEHKDSMGNGSQMRPGDVQIMSAGAGVTHSEFNASSTEMLHFLQMWIVPRKHGTRPRYEQTAVSVEERSGKLRLVVSPDGHDGSLSVDQDARLYTGLLASGERMRHKLPSGRTAWIHVARGRLNLNDLEFSAGDGAAIRDEPILTIQGLEEAEFVLWELREN